MMNFKSGLPVLRSLLKGKGFCRSIHLRQNSVRCPNGISPNKQPKIVEYKDLFNELKSGDNVFVHGAAATPTPLLETLHDAILAKDLNNIRSYHIHMEGEGVLTRKTLKDRVRANSLFTGKNVREAINDGTADFIPIFLSKIPKLFRNNYINLDFALIQVSSPDSHGFVSLGTSVDVALSAVETAKVVIAMVNKRMPRTFGDGIIHISNLDYVVLVDEEIHLHPSTQMSEAELKIGKYIAENLVEDGCTLQMGIGNVPNAVMTQIKSYKNLGIHSEMISDTFVDLITEGYMNNSNKNIRKGISVSSFCVGTRKLFDFIDNNPEINMLDVAYTNDPYIIAQNPKVVAINSCLEVDLTGQVVSDSLGTKIYSGVGGQMDFISGALLSRDGLGKAVLTLQSQTNKGVSKIVPFIKQGAGVITTRNHVQYIVTEFGIADLFGKNLVQRAYQLINIAHPNHREELERAAFERLKVMPHL